MTHISEHDPLGGYEQRLLTELRTLVEQQVAAAAHHSDQRAALHAPRTSRWIRAHGRSLSTAGAGIAAACALLLVVWSGTRPTPAQAFPILSRPSTVIPRAALASLLHDGQSTLSAAHARLDAQQARAFSTPLGTGYVMTDATGNLLCVAAPGLPTGTGITPRTWDSSCGSADDAARTGTGVLLSYSAAHPNEVFVVDILPKDATATIRHPDGTTEPLPLSDGVLATIAPTTSQITTTIGGRSSTIDLPTSTIGG